MYFTIQHLHLYCCFFNLSACTNQAQGSLRWKPTVFKDQMTHQISAPLKQGLAQSVSVLLSPPLCFFLSGNTCQHLDFASGPNFLPLQASWDFYPPTEKWVSQTTSLSPSPPWKCAAVRLPPYGRRRTQPTFHPSQTHTITSTGALPVQANQQTVATPSRHYSPYLTRVKLRAICGLRKCYRVSVFIRKMEHECSGGQKGG